MNWRLRTALRKSNGRCHWCAVTLIVGVDETHPQRATIDHVVPRSRGGRDAVGNRVASCFACNQAKANKLPEQWTPPRPPPARAEWARAASMLLHRRWEALGSMR